MSISVGSRSTSRRSPRPFSRLEKTVVALGLAAVVAGVLVVLTAHESATLRFGAFMDVGQAWALWYTQRFCRRFMRSVNTGKE